jgi:hypothetical protein
MLAALAICALSLSSQAQLVTYIGADPGANSTAPRLMSNAQAAAFDLAAGVLGSVTIIDFESSPLGAFASLTPVAGVTITGSGDYGVNPTVVNSPVGTPDNLFGYNTTASGSQFVSLYGGTLSFAFADPIQAFGAYLSGLQGNVVGTETFTFWDGGSQTVNIPNLSGGIAFVGFTDAGKSISSLTIDVHHDIVGVDDVRFVKAPQRPGGNVPEPGSIAFLIGVGATGGLAGIRRLRRSK